MPQVAHELQHLVAPLGIHAVGGFVEEQQIRIVHERLRQLDALLHAGRVGLDIPVARFIQANVVEHLVRALHRIHAPETRELPAVRDERHGVHARNMRVVLRHVADAGANLERRFGDVETEHRHASFSRRHEAKQALEHRALAGAVGSQEADGAFREQCRHAAQRVVLAIHDAHIRQPDHGIVWSGGGWRRRWDHVGHRLLTIRLMPLGRSRRPVRARRRARAEIESRWRCADRAAGRAPRRRGAGRRGSRRERMLCLSSA